MALSALFLFVSNSRAGWRGETVSLPAKTQVDTIYIGSKLGTISEPSRPPTRYPTLDDENVIHDKTVLGYVWPLSERWFLFAGAGIEVSRQIWSEWRAAGKGETEQLQSQLFLTVEIGIGIIF